MNNFQDRSFSTKMSYNQTQSAFMRHPSLYKGGHSTTRSDRVSSGAISKSPLVARNPGRTSINRNSLTRSRPGELQSVYKRLSVTKTPSRVNNSTTKTWKLSDFELCTKLGRGKFGKVFCAKEISTGFLCALKVMSKKELTAYKVEAQFIREVEIQKSLRHVNCARLYDWFQDAHNVYLIIELAGNGELYKLLKKKRRFDEVTASYYIYQVSNALMYLHSKNIMHRDLKPENILLDLDNTVKVSDFGWSIYTPVSKSKRRTLCGTLDYLSPEVVEGREYDQTVDIWTLGILVYEFLVGDPPFEQDNQSDTYNKIKAVAIDIPPFVSREATDLIKKMLTKNPSERITLQEIEKHPWMLKHKASWPVSNAI